MTSLFSQLHVKYLGLPLVSGKLSLKYFKPLLDKVEARISSRTVRKLTLARRLQLLQSILRNIQSFRSSQFILHNKVIKVLEQKNSTNLYGMDRI